jgi:hypothetical protein
MSRPDAAVGVISAPQLLAGLCAASHAKHAETLPVAGEDLRPPMRQPHRRRLKCLLHDRLKHTGIDIHYA